MKNLTAILSMLHESPDRSSATRLFRGEPVLRWTLERLSRSKRIGTLAILCWEDQLESVRPVAEEERAYVLAKGPRVALPEIQTVAASRRWADGWRGGLLGACHFDLGFYAPWHHELAERVHSHAVVLVDPAAALVDPALLDALAAQADEHEELELCFSPAPPGLGSVLLKLSLLNKLAAAKVHSGRLLHYHPDQVSREALAADSCAPVPSRVARAVGRFTMDSDRQIRILSAATEPLNGQLLSSGAEELVSRVQAARTPLELPREIVLELNTRRSTRPIFWPGNTLEINRPDMTPALAGKLIGELSSLDDIRLTLAGLGDPLLCPYLIPIIETARQAGVSILVETDLHDVAPEAIARLVASPVDVVSVHLPAVSPQTYAKLMGCDGYTRVVENIRTFVSIRKSNGGSLPLIVPVFTKCPENVGEMEAWYDQWLRALGSAVIRSPSDHAGQIPDTAVADMTPPGRKACARLWNRLTILSDGTVVSCELDVLGRQPMGRIGAESLRDTWQRRMESLRSDHRQGQWNKHPLCGRCREWHRP
ncbi:MAG TPA: SPASM domain-containing protein [Tepidisphaeraceae bacterium]|nr:SPASM domain-containing protein [Tepidisphaeraceae bacterium]